MSSSPEIFTLQKLNRRLNDGSLEGDSVKNQSTNEGEDLTSIFKEMHLSALVKAVKISPGVKEVTLGINSPVLTDNDTTLHESVRNKPGSNLSIPFCSTPKRNCSDSNSKKLVKTISKVESVSPLLDNNNVPLENIYSHQKLLKEYEFQRRLTVDKVMRERIQNMYDTSKLIRDSMEHLKQTRQEEAITRRILLETKIISDIQEQEVLNKPKRAAQWEKDNLKEAQRIQERNQKVKEAEEEAKKKSEAILLKRKQIDKILFSLQKEYNQEYRNVLEAFKLCKDKVAVTELSSNHSKELKDCALLCESILKKCKVGNITEEDVKTSQKLVETIKSIHEAIAKEISKINNAKTVVAEVKVENKKNETEAIEEKQSAAVEGKKRNHCD
ncbi:hypothetical protein RUM44_008491 [Polyplax serrata]|uniref:Uncharacterized protein n=1 Tax=Polyplax serrata TaxID=468196 RepID=A0ABR1BCF3_POLSC